MAATAVVVLVPEADPVIGDLRAEHTPGGRRGMPAHVTLLVPFVDSDQLDNAVIGRVSDAMRGVGPFGFVLRDVAHFDTGVFYLTVEPVEPFRDVIARLCAAFPAFAPYAGEFTSEEVIPHCTIAVGEGFPRGPTADDLVLFDRAEANVRALLPIEGGVVRITVMADEPDGWRPMTEIALEG